MNTDVTAAERDRIRPLQQQRRRRRVMNVAYLACSPAAARACCSLLLMLLLFGDGIVSTRIDLNRRLIVWNELVLSVGSMLRCS